MSIRRNNRLRGLDFYIIAGYLSIMRKLSFAFLFFIITSGAVNAQDQGIGLRLGDPMGLTYKKYLDRSHAIELGFGTAGPGWDDAYYRNSFDARDKYEAYRYRSHRVSNTLYLQARYLLHNPIHVQDLEGKWDWYWGLGGVLKISKVRYHYDKSEPPFDDYDVYNDLDFGPEGIIGTEYTFQGIPLTVFGEVSLMLEIVDRIALQPFGGAGVRYNF